MLRKIIKIDEDKCNGCTLCVSACHEGAIAMVDGKAKLTREDYCDGLGDCLPACPTGAISFEEREALPFVQPPQSDTNLSQWPIQLKLVPVLAPYFNGSHILVAADCCGFTYNNFSKEFIKGKSMVLACPKLDMTDYSEKLTEIFKHNDIKSITVTRMVVPCCGGIEYAVKQAVQNCGKDIPLNVVTISLDGKIL